LKLFYASREGCYVIEMGVKLIRGSDITVCPRDLCKFSPTFIVSLE
jgi:hypothetical protein